MNLLTNAHRETHEALNNARTAFNAGEITKEQLNDFVLSLFKAEAEYQILGKYAIPADPTAQGLDEVKQ